MRREDIAKYRKKTDEQLDREIPNWGWYKSLKPGDKVIVFTDTYGLTEGDYRDREATVTRGYDNGLVEVVCEGERLEFWYCGYPNDMDVIIGLKPPKK